MKTLSKPFFLLISLVCIVVALSLSGCSKDDGLATDEQRIKDLTSSWQLSSVINDDADVTGQFTGFVLNIDGTNYTTQNGGNAWTDIGNYSFVDNNIDHLLRDDNVQITIDSFSSSEMTLSFNINQVTTGGRQQGVTGQFTFSLIKQ